VLGTKGAPGDYAMAVESALRIPDAFRLARAYPHVYLHEPDLPAAHAAHVAARVPRAVFRSLGAVFRRPRGTPPEAAWVARDRSPGYKTMCRFYGLQVFGAMRDLGVDAFMRVDDDVLFLGAVAYDPFQWMYEAGAVYVYGTAVREDHDVTERTLGAWVFEFCAGIDWGWTKVDCGALRDDVFGRMFFNNAAAGADAGPRRAPRAIVPGGGSAAPRTRRGAIARPNARRGGRRAAGRRAARTPRAPRSWRRGPRSGSRRPSSASSGRSTARAPSTCTAGATRRSRRPRCGSSRRRRRTRGSPCSPTST